MKSKTISIFLCVVMVATVFAVAVPMNVSAAPDLDAGGPYGTPDNPLKAGEPITFTPTLSGLPPIGYPGGPQDYVFRWDVDGDGEWDTSGTDGWIGFPGIYDHTYDDDYIGEAKVEAWDGTYKSPDPDTIEGYADVCVVNPTPSIADIYDDLNIIELPSDAPQWVLNLYNKALEYLQDAMEKYEAGDISRALRDLSRAVLRLVLIKDQVEGIEEIILQIIDFTNTVVLERIQQAIDDADSGLDNWRVAKAQNAYEWAQTLAENGYYYLAMLAYRLAYWWADRVAP